MVGRPGQQQRGQGVEKYDEQMKNGRVVAPGEIGEVFDQFYGGTTGGLVFLGREEKGEVPRDALVVAEGVVVVGVEPEVGDAGETERREQRDEGDIGEPGAACCLNGRIPDSHDVVTIVKSPSIVSWLEQHRIDAQSLKV